MVACSSACRYDIVAMSLFQEKNLPISLCHEPLGCNDCCVSNKTAYAPSLQIGGLVDQFPFCLSEVHQDLLV
jgi:hypothetical protein